MGGGRDKVKDRKKKGKIRAKTHERVRLRLKKKSQECFGKGESTCTASGVRMTRTRVVKKVHDVLESHLRKRLKTQKGLWKV